MSKAGSTNTSAQSPREEILERVAENFPTWQIGRLIGLDHLNKSLGSARARVNDSHKIQMAKLQEVSGHEMELENIGDEMSEIRVAGDTTNYINQGGGALEKVFPLLLSSLIGAGAVWYLLRDPEPTPIVRPDVNWQLGLEVKDEP